jgi:copper homeostasis protein
MCRERIALEICAYSLKAAQIAQAAGADRIELCADISADGTTPSFDDIASARKSLTLKLHAMIRPRGGDFVYSAAEFFLMKNAIENCRHRGVDGVALGILLPSGNVDKRRCRELVQLSSPMAVTFHRAFDVATDPFHALEDVIEIGCKRILTSGQRNSAMQGADLIEQLVKQAQGRIVIMPGGGIRAENLAELIQMTGAREFHTSAQVAGRPDAAQMAAMRKIADRLS